MRKERNKDENDCERDRFNKKFACACGLSVCFSAQLEPRVRSVQVSDTVLNERLGHYYHKGMK